MSQRRRPEAGLAVGFGGASGTMGLSSGAVFDSLFSTACNPESIQADSRRTVLPGLAFLVGKYALAAAPSRNTSLTIGRRTPASISCAISISCCRLASTMKKASFVFVLSGRIETENVTQLESLITAEPTPIVFDLKDPTKGPR
jgi:hypothetical protein